MQGSLINIDIHWRMENYVYSINSVHLKRVAIMLKHVKKYRVDQLLRRFMHI